MPGSTIPPVVSVKMGGRVRAKILRGDDCIGERGGGGVLITLIVVIFVASCVWLLASDRRGGSRHTGDIHRGAARYRVKGVFNQKSPDLNLAQVHTIVGRAPAHGTLAI